MTGPTQGSFTCAAFTSAKGITTIGWLPNATLVPLPEEAPAPMAFVGHWVGPEQDVTIAPAGGKAVGVKGDATLGMSAARLRSGASIHTGEVVGTARPEKGILAFTMGTDDKTLPYAEGGPDGCRVRMWRCGPYL